MPLSSHPKIWRVLVILAILLACGFTLCYYFQHIFYAFIIGFVLILITEKLTSDFRKSAERYKLSLWKRWCYGILLLIFWLFVIGFLLRNSFGQIADELQKISVDEHTVSSIYAREVYPHLPTFFRNDTISVGIIEWVSVAISSLAGSVLSQTFAFVINGLLIIPLLFYLYFWRRKVIAKRLFGAVPERFRKSFHRAAKGVGGKLHDYFTARVIQSTVIGALCCLGFFIAGVKGWLLLGLLAGFLNAVPYFGPILGAIPPFIITLLVDESFAALYVLLTVFVAQTIDVFYLQPFMISGKVKIDPLVSIILVLAGTKLFGIFGTIFILPMYLVSKVILQEAYRELVRLYGR